MREIKFRGKTLTGELVYGDLIHDGFDGTSKKIEIGIAKPGCYPVEVIPESVGQYINLDDKNGKEIYEGDKVKYLIYKDGKPWIEHSGKIIFDEIFSCFTIEGEIIDWGRDNSDFEVIE